MAWLVLGFVGRTISLDEPKFEGESIAESLPKS